MLTGKNCAQNIIRSRELDVRASNERPPIILMPTISGKQPGKSKILNNLGTEKIALKVESWIAVLNGWDSNPSSRRTFSLFFSFYL